MVTNYDALLLVSFGGPEGPDDVVPFLENVTRGRGVPPERLRGVAEHYQRFGGVSPINAQNRALLASLRAELARRDLVLPVYWGNRNWHPLLTEALQEITHDEVGSVLAIFTSAYSSYSGCRQYREDLASAATSVGDAPFIDRVGPYFNIPGFVESFVDSTLRALDELPAQTRDAAPLLFTTHSIPIAMAESSGVPGGAYVRQHQEVARLVAERLRVATGVDREWSLAYQSRSGPPQVPWLEPDVREELTALPMRGVSAVVVVPIGFVSDHMEVVWDLDVEAAELAAELGLQWARAATPGTDPRFVSGLVDLVVERLNDVAVPDRPRLGVLGPSPERCLTGCCPNPRTWAPAVAGSD